MEAYFNSRDLSFRSPFGAVTEGQELRNVQSVRELPSEGYKDFNDELLDKKAYTITDQIETALDETDLVIEEQDEYEEEKRHGIHR